MTKIIILLLIESLHALARATDATTCQNCKVFQFNGAYDTNALSQMQEFLAGNIGNDVTIETKIVHESQDATPTSTAPPQKWHEWQESGNRHYKCFNDEIMTYSEAKSHCNIFQGKLAAEVLRDPDVVSYIASRCVAPGSDSHHPWIGLGSIERDGQSKWSDGGAIEYITTQWIAGRANGGNCAQIWEVTYEQRQGTLMVNDNNCDERYNFICEV